MVPDISRFVLAPQAMERYTLGPLVITVSNVAWPCIVTKELVTRILEYGEDKIVQTSNEDT